MSGATSPVQALQEDGLLGSQQDLPADFDPLADGILMSHQKTWLEDRTPVKIAEKCRRSGFTFAEALDDTITAATARGEGGSNVFYIGDTRDKGREFIGYCATFAKTVAKELVSIDEFLFEDHKEDGTSKFISSFRITFASGFSIVALSSRPENIRGLQGIVVIDEAAFHKDVGEVIDAAVALLIWGGRIRIISTHNGRLNAFNDLIARTRAGKTSYSVQRITFDEVIENGLYERVKMMRPDIMPFDKWYETIRSSYTDKAREREELDTIPRDAEGSAVSRVQVLACVDRTIPVIRLSKEPDFLEFPEEHRRAEIAAWCEAHLAPVLAQLHPHVRKALGADIARKGHLTSFWLATIGAGMKRETAVVVELRRLPFENQRQILFFILDRLKGVWSAAIDAGGLGADTAESARVRYGERVEEVTLSAGWYRDHGPKIVSAIEDVTISVPSDDDIVTDICALAYVNGAVKIPDKFENTGADGGKRHADTAIAALLMEFAAQADVVEFGSHSAGRRLAEADAYAADAVGHGGSAWPETTETRKSGWGRSAPASPMTITWGAWMADMDEAKKQDAGPPPGEAAAARDGDEFLNLWLDGIREPEDPILQGRGSISDLRLFDEVRGDAQVWSTLQQRRDAVVAMPWDVKPGDDRPASIEAAEELKEQLTGLPMDTITRRMLWGAFYGYGVGEVIWSIKGNRVTFGEIRVRRARRFGFDVDGALMLRPTINRNPGRMPDRKFWVMSVGSDTDDEPYGLGLAHLLYWPVYFRRHGLRAWMMALDKFALPTAVGRFPPGTNQDDIDKALAALKAIRSNSSIMLPDTFPVDFLESSKSAGMDYHKFHEFLDGMIAKIVLSQTMTTDDGSSRSQGEVHMKVRDEVAQADADLLCGSFNEGPATWWTEWNYGADAAPPLLMREKDEPEDADKAASRDEKLARIGWRPNEQRMQTVYGDGYEKAEPTGAATPSPDEEPVDLSAEQEPDAIADFVDRMMAEGAPQAAAADMLAPLVDLIEGVDDLEDLRDRLDGFSLSDEALAPFADHLARAAFAARIGGEVGVPLREDVEEESL